MSSQKEKQMSKMKTKKSVKKRFKVTGTGKVLHRSLGMRHRRTHKSKSQIRSLKTVKELQGYNAIKVKKILGV